ncbi:H-NS family nucleoid-associated regulatory protein [Motilimonas eburnea]|uniref:H-NS family histone-like protein n=1 Tax=Motilimonas eburnea TaxID=1737488 RepID=UPI001E4AC9FE|nr:H-NS family nucleoid-associated regulatory protein [Motilimonas eburnea]MCE2572548.1 H-NS histone family protein [Motilimonas eburnea]
MSDVIKALLNARSLKAASKDLTLEQLEESLAKFTKIVEERKSEEAAARAANEEKLRKLEEYKEMLKADGIDPTELLGTVVKETKKREPRPAKYQYRDEQGELRQWTGQGRKPKPIQKAIDEGKTLDDFLI